MMQAPNQMQLKLDNRVTTMASLIPIATTTTTALSKTKQASDSDIRNHLLI
jgi:hypothetical protein